MSKQIGLLLCIVMFAVTVKGRAACPTVPDRLAEYVQSAEFVTLSTNLGIDTKNQRVRFVVYDHRATPNGALTAYTWKRDASPTPDDFLLESMAPVGGIPNLKLPRNSPVIFAVANTAPLLFKLTKTTTTSDIPALADFQAIAGGFGTMIQSLIAAAGQRTTIAVAAAPGSGAFQWIPEPTVELQALASAMKDVQQVGRDLAALKTRTVDYLRLAEQEATDTELNAQKVAHARFQGLFINTQQKFRALEKALDDVEATDFARIYGCAPLAEVARDAAALDDTAAIQAKLVELHNAIQPTTCSDDAKNHLLALLGTQEKEQVVQYVFVSDRLRQALDQAGTASAKQGDAEELSASLEAFGRRLQTVAKTDNPCDVAFGFVVADRPDEIEFTKQGVVKATIAEDSPLGATYLRTTLRAAETEFRIANPIADRLGVSVGVIYTAYDEPTYKAVTNPLNADQKVIARTDETSRAGELALLGNYWLTAKPSDFRPGIQFGVGLSDTPSVFGGVAFDVVSFLRVGAGITVQRARDLDGNQRALAYKSDGTVDAESLTVVSSNDDIIYRNTHPVAAYFSLSIILEGLPFLKKP